MTDNETYTVDDATFQIDGENVGIEDMTVEDITFERSEEGRDDNKYREAKITNYEFEMSVKGERSFDSREEYVQHLIDMGYTVVRDSDGNVRGVWTDLQSGNKND